MNLRFCIDILLISSGFFSTFLYIIEDHNNYINFLILNINMFFLIPLYLNKYLASVFYTIYTFFKLKKSYIHMYTLLNLNKIITYYIIYVIINIILCTFFNFVNYEVFLLDFLSNYAFMEDFHNINISDDNILLDSIYYMSGTPKSFFDIVLNNSRGSSRNNSPRPPENNNNPVHTGSNDDQDNSNVPSTSTYYGTDTDAPNTAASSNDTSNAATSSNDAYNDATSSNDTQTATTSTSADNSSTNPPHDWSKMKYFGDPKYHTTGTPGPTLEQVMAKADRLVTNNLSAKGARFSGLTGEERTILKDHYLNNAKCPDILTQADKNNLINETKLTTIKLEKIMHAIKGFRDE